MKKIYSILIIASACFASFNCKKSDSPDTIGTGRLGIYFTPSSYFFHVLTIPLRVYVDGQLKSTWDATNTTLDCYGRQVDILIELSEGQHSVAFVSPDGHYVDGNATIAKGQCCYVNLSEDQFSTSKTNYGTNNGCITFYRTDLLIYHTYIYVDDIYLGDLQENPFHTICGMDASPRNLMISLPPGVHKYKAVEPNDVTWTGTITVQANNCYNLQLHH